VRLLEGQRAKLGLRRADPADDTDDGRLADDWLTLLKDSRVDFTNAWRRLSASAAGDDGPLRELFQDPARLDAWLERWRARCASEEGGATPDAAAAGAARAARMRSVNPRIIPRNHRVEEVLAAASGESRFEPFERLLEALRRPYDDAAELEEYAEPAPAAFTGSYRTFCGT
jgi:serine/tyrosine/threonine adenylyltransferase